MGIDHEIRAARERGSEVVTVSTDELKRLSEAYDAMADLVERADSLMFFMHTPKVREWREDYEFFSSYAEQI